MRTLGMRSYATPAFTGLALCSTGCANLAAGPNTFEVQYYQHFGGSELELTIPGNVTFAAAAAPEIDSRSAVAPLALMAGLFALVADRRIRRS